MVSISHYSFTDLCIIIIIRLNVFCDRFICFSAIDGDAPLEKQVTLDKMAQKRQKMYDNIADLLELQSNNNSPNTTSMINSEITKLERRCVVFSQKTVQDVLYFFELLGLPVIRENEEADFILAKLSAANKIGYILSDDSDVLAFGAKKV